MPKKHWASYATAYALWLMVMLLGVWLLLMGRNSLLMILALTTDPTSFDAIQLASFIDRAYVFIAGLGWVILMVVSEHYFRTGVKKGSLWARAARVFGIVFVAIFVADLIVALGQGLQFISAARWLILIAEFSLGVGLLVLSRRLKAHHQQEIQV
jgi:hypothetical protein